MAVIPEKPIIGASPRPSVGLYVHVPFCETKCGYCDFYSVALQGRKTRPLVDALCTELSIRVAKADHRIRTVFIGGGTPTLLPAEELGLLLSSIGQCASVGELDEFTVEANPATVDDEKAALLVARGVTRVSMGAQSFIPSELATLERLHSPDDILPSIRTLEKAGVRHLNLDLIFGIPGQSLATWGESLDRTIALGPDHIACYGLTYEPATAMTARRDRGLLATCDEDLESEMYLYAIETLSSAGFHQYEISNFARPGCESRHNLVYWRNEPYVGVGPSAAGCYERRRYKNVPEVTRYVRMMAEERSAEIESEILDDEKVALEIILMQLRLNEGLSLIAFEELTGSTFGAAFGLAGPDMKRRGLLEMTPTHVRLSAQGRLVANRVISELAESLGTLQGA
ncbi:MAG: radical SAM family heme chaperone HemW [Burkholderiales bacterium]